MARQWQSRSGYRPARSPARHALVVVTDIGVGVVLGIVLTTAVLLALLLLT